MAAAAAAAAAAALRFLSSAVHTQPGHTFAPAQSLFLLLSIVFFLLAGGVSNLHAHKVGAGCSSTHKWAAWPGRHIDCVRLVAPPLLACNMAHCSFAEACCPAPL